MPSLLKIAWLIPFSPLFGAIFVLLLLISFNRTINRLTKPVSYFLITCVALSTIMSFILYQKHSSGNILDINLIILNLQLHWELYVDRLAAIASTAFGLIILTIMICSYFLMDRKKGYVSYFIALGLGYFSILSFILSGDLFHNFF